MEKWRWADVEHSLGYKNLNLKLAIEYSGSKKDTYFSDPTFRSTGIS